MLELYPCRSWRQTMTSARDRSPRHSNAANRSVAISRANTHPSSDARNFYAWHPVNSVNETRQGIFPLTSGAQLETIPQDVKEALEAGTSLSDETFL